MNFSRTVKSVCCLHKSIPLCSVQRLMSSQGSRHPTIVSGGDPRKIVHALSLNRISTVIMAGTPNRPFPDELNVDINDMSEGAKQAINVVTSSIQSGDLQDLHGLLSNDCIQGLTRSLSDVDIADRNNITINPEDIFFSWLDDFKFEKDKQSMLVNTMSMPSYAALKQKMQESRNLVAEMQEKLKSNKNMDEFIEEEKQNFQEILKERNKETSSMLLDNHIILGNFRFERQNSNYDWTITEVNQADLRDRIHSLFYRRWKGRLGISLKLNKDFNSVLRFDYATDWFAFLVAFNVVFGGVDLSSFKPHN